MILINCGTREGTASQDNSRPINLLGVIIQIDVCHARSNELDSNLRI